MIRYALRCVKERPALWVPSLLLALLAALPGALVATALAPSATAFLLTADLDVAAALLPGGLADRDATAWLLVAAGGALLLALWVRTVLVVLWCSDNRKQGSLAQAWRGTRGSWWKGVVLHAEAQVVVAAIVVLLVGLAALTAPPELAGVIAFVAAVAAVAARAVVRVALALALRAVTLDGARHGAAWSRAREVLMARRHDAIAGWIALLAAGVALWIGGRLVTPVLQETALAYGHDDPATALREAAQLLFAVPIEAFLVAVSAGLWTAIYLGGDAMKERHPRDRPAADPWFRRALMVLVVLVLVGNGIPTIIDRRVRDERENARVTSARAQIQPEDARRDVTDARRLADYTVTATLDGDQLEWSTSIRWRNDTGATVDDLGIHVYANAFTRDVEEIPLARDVLQSPAIRRRVRRGTFDVTRVAVSGAPVDTFSLSGTALSVPLETPLASGESTNVEVTLAANLPRFPERFGVWDDVTLLGNWIPVVALREDGAWRFDDYGTVGDPFVSETASYDVSLSLEPHIGAVGSGVLVAVDEGAGRRTWRFRANGMRDAAFALSPVWRGLERRAGDTIVRAWFPADDALVGKQLAEAGESAVAEYTRRFGELPFDEVEVVQTRGVFGGMEYPGVVFVSAAGGILEGFPLLPDLLEHAGFEDAARRYIVGHEVAHQWWYASAGNDQVREPWLDEALAELSTRLWLRAQQGDDRTWLMTNLVTPPRPEPGVVSASIADFDDNAAYADEVYIEGSQVLLRLRDEIGSSRLYELLREWHRRARGRIGTVDEFVATVRDVVGPEAAAIIERFR